MRHLTAGSRVVPVQTLLTNRHVLMAHQEVGHPLEKALHALARVLVNLRHLLFVRVCRGGSLSFAGDPCQRVRVKCEEAGQLLGRQFSARTQVRGCVQCHVAVPAPDPHTRICYPPAQTQSASGAASARQWCRCRGSVRGGAASGAALQQTWMSRQAGSLMHSSPSNGG